MHERPSRGGSNTFDPEITYTGMLYDEARYASLRVSALAAAMKRALVRILQEQTVIFLERDGSGVIPIWQYQC